MTDQITELELWSEEAEKALIGAVAFHSDSLTATINRLDPGAFYWGPRGVVWRAFQQLTAAREHIHPVSVSRKLGEMDALNRATQELVMREMIEAYPAHYAPRNAEIVADLAVRRDLIRRLTASRVLVRDHPGDVSELYGRIRENFAPPADAQENRKGGPMRWRALVAEFEAEHEPNQDRMRVPTPWVDMDRLLGGLHGSRVYVFGGRPGQGKSTAALAIAHHAAILGHETLVFSKEMPSVDVTGRLMARGASVDLHAINARTLGESEREKIRAYTDEIGDIALTVDATPRNLAGILTAARAHKHRYGLELLVVDYLQLVHTDQPGRNREQEVAQVSMQLKRLAMELNCAVVLPAQLNRGSLQRSNPRPTMSDLRDSGQIEQDADVVILLHREKDDDGHPTGVISFIVDKNRHGTTAEISLDWLGGYGNIL